MSKASWDNVNFASALHIRRPCVVFKLAGLVLSQPMLLQEKLFFIELIDYTFIFDVIFFWSVQLSSVIQIFCGKCLIMKVQPEIQNLNQLFWACFLCWENSFRALVYWGQLVHKKSLCILDNISNNIGVMNISLFYGG